MMEVQIVVLVYTCEQELAILIRERARRKQAEARARQSEQQGYLKPVQLLLVLAVYVLAQYDLISSAELVKRLYKQRKPMIARPDEDIKTMIEDMFLKSSEEDVSRIHFPITDSDTRVRDKALVFLSEFTTAHWICRQNFECGVAPSTVGVATNYLANYAHGLPSSSSAVGHLVQNACVNSSSSRSLRRWGSIFRQNWSMRFAAIKPRSKMDPEELQSKAP
jgi:hypothetical protein